MVVPENTYTIINPVVKIKRKQLVLDENKYYTFHEVNSTYYKKKSTDSYYVHCFILTADLNSKEELKIDFSFDLLFKEPPFNIVTFLKYNLPQIFSSISDTENQIPERLLDLEIFRLISYSYSSEIDPIEHRIPN